MKAWKIGTGAALFALILFIAPAWAQQAKVTPKPVAAPGAKPVPAAAAKAAPQAVPEKAESVFAPEDSGQAMEATDESEPAAPDSSEQPAEEAPEQAAPPKAAQSESAPVPPERIEATVEKIEEMIALPPTAQLGREIDEPEKPTALFSDAKRIQELLGDEPRYVYVPMGGDPMIVPWVRERVMASELLAEAEQHFREGRMQEAIVRCNMIVERFPRSDGAPKAQALKSRIEKMMAAPEPGKEGEIRPIEVVRQPLPTWIQQNTRGILFNQESPKESLVLIGDFLLATGDTIPNYAGIRVKEISKSIVTYDFQGDLYKVMVEGD